MDIDASELHTETFSNSQGWTVVRVTHLPSGLAVERTRSKDLQSPVQAQTQCIAEVKERLGRRDLPPAAPTKSDADVVSRAEFESLAMRVEELERALNGR